MEAKDLMIGDWVINTEFDKNEICQMEVIEPNRVWVNGGKTYIPICYIKPIPLTPDILEKNGFVRSEVFVEWKYEYEDIYMLWKPFPWLSVLSDESEIKFPCEYVHELQHALKLCGIEKEIVL